jgi:hypothetical protein
VVLATSSGGEKQVDLVVAPAVKVVCEVSQTMAMVPHLIAIFGGGV